MIAEVQKYAIQNGQWLPIPRTSSPPPPPPDISEPSSYPVDPSSHEDNMVDSIIRATPLSTMPDTSALPRSLSGDAITKEADFILSQNLSPCLEFCNQASVASPHEEYHWTMWMQPIRGCRDAGQVLQEVAVCRRTHP